MFSMTRQVSCYPFLRSCIKPNVSRLTSYRYISGKISDKKVEQIYSQMQKDMNKMNKHFMKYPRSCSMKHLTKTMSFGLTHFHFKDLENFIEFEEELSKKDLKPS